MADFADYATDQEAAHINMALASFKNKQNKQTESACKCFSCSEPIPEARRLAVPGCVLCIDCQEREEKGGFWD
jgi:phage/conjugal plasmid C-4 type zinc finger TraR family protein